MVPTVIPPVEDSSDEEAEPPSKPAPPIFDVSFYNKKASLVFKVCNRNDECESAISMARVFQPHSVMFQLSHTLKSGSAKSVSSKVVFEPVVELKTEGMALEILARGLLFLDVHFGIVSAVVTAIDQCVCGVHQPDCETVGPTVFHCSVI